MVIADSNFGYSVVSNALGQLGISIGGFCKEKIFEQETLVDKDGNFHYVDGFFPMINLSNNQKQMSYFALKCFEANIQFFDFSTIMKKAHSDDEMIKEYAAHSSEEISYIAVGALVPKDLENDFIDNLELFK